MTNEQVRQALLECAALLQPYFPLRVEDLRSSELSRGARLSHAAWMCVRAQEYVKYGNTEKAIRWLGFIQGVLWMSGIVSIETPEGVEGVEGP